MVNPGTAYARVAHLVPVEHECSLCQFHTIDVDGEEQETQGWVACLPAREGDTAEPAIHLECFFKQLAMTRGEGHEPTCSLCRRYIVKLDQTWIGSPYQNFCYARHKGEAELIDFFQSASINQQSLVLDKVIEKRDWVSLQALRDHGLPEISWAATVCQSVDNGDLVTLREQLVFDPETAIAAKYLGVAVHLAANRNNREALRALLEHGRIPKDSITKSIVAAVMLGNRSCLTPLLEYAESNRVAIPIEYINNAVRQAIHTNNQETLVLLLNSLIIAGTPIPRAISQEWENKAIAHPLCIPAIQNYLFATQPALPGLPAAPLAPPPAALPVARASTQSTFCTKAFTCVSSIAIGILALYLQATA